MNENSTNDLVHTLREHGARYVVGAQGQAIAVLLTLEEYEHYLDSRLFALAPRPHLIRPAQGPRQQRVGQELAISLRV
ncbi:MAG: hypothetical protein DRN07_05755, partial [Thermoplasmata archaeon]